MPGTNRKSFNALAKKDGLELVQDKTYLWWYGLNDETALKLASLKSTGVYVYRFSHLSWVQWLGELESIKKQISKVEL